MSDPAAPRTPDTDADADRPACPKCKSLRVRMLSAPDGEPYVLCRECGFEFHQPRGGHGPARPRGVPPLKVVLTGLIFARSLPAEAPRMAASLMRQFAPEDVRCFMEEIVSVLADHDRTLHTEFDLPHPELDVRAFLAGLVDALERQLDGEG